MTDLYQTIDLGLPRKQRTGLGDILRLFVSALARSRNDRNMIGLEGFSDSQLADIGLTRDDIVPRRAAIGLADTCDSYSRAVQLRFTRLYLL